MNLAPVILFAYKRLDTLKKTIEALQKNNLASQSDFYVFSDAAKTIKDEDAVRKVREYLRTICHFKSFIIEEAEVNKGLANSIIQGVTKVFEKHDFVIVIEDDLVTSTNFLNFMNDSLQKFQYESSVFSIAGYSFDLNLTQSIHTDTYFLNRGWSWGWATWKDRWEKIDWEISDYHTFIKNREERKAFSKGGSDLNKMLDKQMSGKLDSWAIRWIYNQYKMKGLTIYPVYSKVKNEGFGKDATHTIGSSRRYKPFFDEEAKTTFTYPENLAITNIAQLKFQRKMGYFSRIKSKIETLLRL